jgi:hypothetical protein
VAINDQSALSHVSVFLLHISRIVVSVLPLCVGPDRFTANSTCSVPSSAPTNFKVTVHRSAGKRHRSFSSPPVDTTTGDPSIAPSTLDEFCDEVRWTDGGSRTGSPHRDIPHQPHQTKKKCSRVDGKTRVHFHVGYEIASICHWNKGYGSELTASFQR